MRSLIDYIQYMELIAFFSGYPLVYGLVYSIGDSFKRNKWLETAMKLLPVSYALTGLLYLGLELKDLYPNYSLSGLQQSLSHPWLTAWAFLAVLFFLPVLARKKQLSLLHSLVFLFLLAKDIYVEFTDANKDLNMIRNDMKIYSASIILNFAALLVVFLISFLLKGKKHQTLS